MADWVPGKANVTAIAPIARFGEDATNGIGGADINYD
jgi:hypothetical protein